MKLKLRYSSALILLITLGCGGSKNSDPIGDAWTLFEAGQYQQSYDQFQSITTGNPEVNVGLGWNAIRLNSIDQADTYFQAIAPDSLEDAYAGWAAVLWIKGDYQGCIDKVNTALRANPDYIFVHDLAVTREDLIWHQASSAFHLGYKTNCISYIQLLEPGFTANPNDVNIDIILSNELEALSNQWQ